LILLYIANPYKVLNNQAEKDDYLKKAYSEAENIQDAEEKQYLINDLKTI
jgi:hypothetical protein